ncbi:unnamed protein product, partial [Rotaria sp. Silwood1]
KLFNEENLLNRIRDFINGAVDDYEKDKGATGGQVD